MYYILIVFGEIYTEVVLYKCQRKPKGQSRIDNPEKLATLDKLEQI
jgi:hypothetical protein